MKNNFIKLIALLLLPSIGSLKSNAQGINLKKFNSWNAVKKQAQEDNKSILVYVTSKADSLSMDMRHLMTTDQNLGTYINQNFVTVEAQMTTDKNLEKSLKESGVDKFPAIVYFSSSGTLTFMVMGYRTPERIKVGAEYALDPEKQYFPKRKAFKDGKREQPFVNNLLALAKMIGDEKFARELITSYEEGLSLNNPLTKDDLSFICHQTEFDDKLFTQLIKEKSNVKTAVTPEVLESWIQIGIYNRVFGKIIMDGIRKDLVPDFAKLKKSVTIFGEQGLCEFLRVKSIYHNELFDKTRQSKEIDSFVLNKTQLYRLFRDAHKVESALDINNDAWLIFQKSDNKDYLEIALEWSKIATQKEPQSGNWMDTYANILYKLGRTSEAISHEEKAVKLENGSQEFKDNLLKMQKGEKTW